MAQGLNLAFEKVKKARSKDRPTAAAFIQRLFPEFMEFHGDRRFADDPAVVGGVGWLRDLPVTVIAQEKGASTRERVERNFGAPNPEGYRKALRLMGQAEKFRRPVVCLVDTSGAFCGIGAEERGQGQAIAENLNAMMALRVPVVSILIGEGGSGGALALAVADQVWMLENAVYSVISPEGCASILWKDSSRAAEAAESLRLTAMDAKELGVVERVISEKGGDLNRVCAGLENELYALLTELMETPVEELLERRYRRFRRLGENVIREG